MMFWGSIQLSQSQAWVLWYSTVLTFGTVSHILQRQLCLITPQHLQRLLEPTKKCLQLYKYLKPELQKQKNIMINNSRCLCILILTGVKVGHWFTALFGIVYQGWDISPIWISKSNSKFQGFLESGVMFDTTSLAERGPLNFTLGTNTVIPGENYSFYHRKLIIAMPTIISLSKHWVIFLSRLKWNFGSFRSIKKTNWSALDYTVMDSYVQ